VLLFLHVRSFETETWYIQCDRIMFTVHSGLPPPDLVRVLNDITFPYYFLWTVVQAFPLHFVVFFSWTSISLQRRDDDSTSMVGTGSPQVPRVVYFAAEWFSRDIPVVGAAKERA